MNCSKHFNISTYKEENDLLREPVGEFSVGVKQIDTKMIGKGLEARRLPVTVFYPSDEKGESMPYLSGDYIRKLRNSQEAADDVVTYCYQNVPLSSNQERYPVIVYSHGLDGYRMDNTVLCADLASQGYIIFSVGHPYGARIVRYTDNTYFDNWEEQIGSNKSCTFFDGAKMVFGSLPILPLCKRNKAWESYCRKYASVQQKLLPLWIEDLIAGMDFVEAIQNGEITTMFEHRLDYMNGFSIIGMSLGGNASVNTGLKDKRVSKVINLDGGLFAKLEVNENKPSILVYCDKANTFSHFSLRAMRYPKLTIEPIVGVSHWQFSDGVYLSDKGKQDRNWAMKVSTEKTNACLSFLHKKVDK